MKTIRIALTKGRLEKDSVALFEKIGLDCTAVREKGRRLILPIGNGEIEVVLAKAADVITYVENGVCDLGVVGKDTIMENGSRFFEILDLGFGRCRFALAAKKGTDFFTGYKEKTVASKYPNVSRQFFESRLQQIPSAWEASLEKARQHGDEKKALIEEIKLAAVSDIKAALEEQK